MNTLLFQQLPNQLRAYPPGFTVLRKCSEQQRSRKQHTPTLRPPLTVRPGKQELHRDASRRPLREQRFGICRCARLPPIPWILGGAPAASAFFLSSALPVSTLLKCRLRSCSGTKQSLYAWHYKNKYAENRTLKGPFNLKLTLIIDLSKTRWYSSKEGTKGGHRAMLATYTHCVHYIPPHQHTSKLSDRFKGKRLQTWLQL